jgi:hypothetical protein
LPAGSPRTTTKRHRRADPDGWLHVPLRKTDRPPGAQFGFCYGVDQTIDYAYQTRSASPTVRSFSPAKSSTTPSTKLKHGRPVPRSGRHRHPAPGPADVVILPAFGVMEMLQRLDGSRTHAHRHDLRLRPQRLEKRSALRRGRYVDYSRQVLARERGDRVPGPRPGGRYLVSSTEGGERSMLRPSSPSGPDGGRHFPNVGVASRGSSPNRTFAGSARQSDG